MSSPLLWWWVGGLDLGLKLEAGTKLNNGTKLEFDTEGPILIFSISYRGISETSPQILALWIMNIYI